MTMFRSENDMHKLFELVSESELSPVFPTRVSGMTHAHRKSRHRRRSWRSPSL